MKINRECVCKICNQIFQNAWKFIEHLQQVHNLTIVDYCAKYEPMYCKACGKQSLELRKDPNYTFAVYGSPFKMHCSNSCQSSYRIKASHSKKHIVTDEYREKRRQSRLKYLVEHPEDNAWHRRNKREMSSLEKWFYNKCIEYDLLSKYDIVRELLEYPYYIDFAFVNCKVAVELDGQTHFKYQSNIEHDKKKNALLHERGWHIYRIAYFEVNDGTFNKFLEFLQYIIIDCPKVFEQRLVSYQDYKNAVEYREKRRKTKYEQWLEYKAERDKQKQLLKNAIANNETASKRTKNSITNKDVKIDLAKILHRRELAETIDRTQNGWVAKVAALWQIRSQHVYHYMKKYMPDLLANAKIRRK